MTLFFRHILNICFMLSVMIMAASCSGSSGVPQEPEDSSDIFLVCNVGMVGETRANPILPNEAMQTLRVIVLDGNGDVEINKYMDFNASYEQTSFIIGVSPGAKKTVYLFANEGAVGSITSDDNTVSISGSLHNYLDGLAVGNEDFEHVISKVYFTPDYSKGIPMNAIYEVNIPEGVKRVEKSMWLVRTACKFSFVFENARRDFDVTISNFEVRGLGDRQFLLPNFTGGIEPSFPGYSSWVDWLKDVSEKSEINPYDPTADQSGWLFRYDVPSTTRTVAFAYESSFTLPKIDSNGNPGSRTIQNRYVAESKQLKRGTTTYPAEQQYSLYISCSSNGVNKNFNVPLPNVRALFRNTHVVVTVSFSDGPFVINPVVDVIPFSEVLVSPHFGLERDDISGYVVVRDPVTGEIKYWLDADGNKWWLFQDGETHFVFAYEEPTLDTLDHWFDYKGVRHELTMEGISGLDPYYNSTSGDLEFYEDKEGHKFWLESDKWFTVNKYGFVENNPNPKGNYLGWYDFTGDFHSPDESKDVALEKWKKILGGLSS